MNRLTWPHVAVVFIVVAGVVTLDALGGDTTALIVLGMALLTGLGLVARQQGEIKNATNGNISRLVALVEAMSKHLRDMPPPIAPPSPPDAEEPPAG